MNIVKNMQDSYQTVTCGGASPHADRLVLLKIYT